MLFNHSLQSFDYMLWATALESIHLAASATAKMSVVVLRDC